MWIASHPETFVFDKKYPQDYYLRVLLKLRLLFSDDQELLLYFVLDFYKLIVNY